VRQEAVVNAEPRFLTLRERLDHERRMSLPKCPECHLRTLHRRDCSKWIPTQPETYYSELRQRQDYRASVRELGCTCSDRMPPHAHGLTCPMYRTEDEWSDHLDEEHA
jgi:hypothetical protein